jgi:hypothetical protein
MKADIQSSVQLAQRVMLASVMSGIALAFIISKHEPGWQPFVVSGTLSLLFLLLAITRPQLSRWVGSLALAALLIGMLWDKDKPLTAIVGLVLAFLNAVGSNSNHSQDSSEESNLEATQG